MAEPQPPPPKLEPRYTRIAYIDAGASGVVYRELDNDSGQEVAVKYIETAKLPLEFVRELQCAHSASVSSCQGVVRFHRAMHLPGYGLAIAMDLCGGPKLLDWMNRLWQTEGANNPRVAGQKQKRAEPMREEPLIRAVFKQLLDAVAALHAGNIGHRDIKCENVCLMTPLGDMTVVPAVKLIDLGLSKSTVDHSAADTLLGTPYYIAPEVYAAGFAASKGAHPSKTTYDPYTADTWALGVLLLTVFRWQFPFHAREGMSLAVNGQLRDKLLEQVGEVNASPAAHDFLLRCFTLKPEDRPTPTTLLNDPWIKAGEPYPQFPQPCDAPLAQLQSKEELNAVIAAVENEVSLLED